jgi:hypothetical protein
MQPGIWQIQGTVHFLMAPNSTQISFFSGICYGYELMASCESPNVPFTLILTRFKKGKFFSVIFGGNFEMTNIQNLQHSCDNEPLPLFDNCKVWHSWSFSEVGHPVIVKFRQCYRLICYHKRDGYQNKKCYALY